MMTNHVHLLASSDNPVGLPRALQSVGRRYVGYFNDRYARTGTLWEGRYHANLVQADSHLVLCHRYIDLNPVRGGLVAQPHEFAWSSHRFYGFGRPDDLVTPHSVIADLGPTVERRQAAYLALFDPPMPAEAVMRIRQALQLQRPLGNEAFIAGFSHGVCLESDGDATSRVTMAPDSDSRLWPQIIGEPRPGLAAVPAAGTPPRAASPRRSRAA